MRDKIRKVLRENINVDFVEFERASLWQNYQNVYLYFNGIKDGSDEYENILRNLGNSGVIDIKVKDKIFRLKKEDLKFNEGNKSVGILVSSVPKEDSDFIKSDEGQKIVKPLLTKKLINEVISEVFSDNWSDMLTQSFDDYNNTRKPGVVGVYTIGERLGNEDEWSLINYFDTNRVLRIYILKDLKVTSGNNIKEKLTKLFSDESKVKEYCDRVWNTLKIGMSSEKEFADKFTDRNIFIPLHGSEMDYKEGVDIMIDGEGYQVKVADKIGKYEGYYDVAIFRQKVPNYLNKSKVKYLVFKNNHKDEFYVFKKEDYIYEYYNQKKVLRVKSSDKVNNITTLGKNSLERTIFKFKNKPVMVV